MHRNPVRRGLVLEPDQWSWSSFRFYACREPGRVLITHPDRPSSKYGVQRPDLVEVRGTHPFAKNAKGWGTLGEGWGTLCYVDAARKGGPPACDSKQSYADCKRVDSERLKCPRCGQAFAPNRDKTRTGA
jgi:hypothetical protein